MPKTTVRLKGSRPDEAWAGTEKVLAWFFSYPTKEFSLTDLCEHLEISKTTANGVVTHLESIGFLQVEQFGRSWRVTTNQRHPLHRNVKIPMNLRVLYGSGVVEHLVDAYPGAKAIVLFGSYRTGDDTEKSDIDIAVELPGDVATHVEQNGILTQFLYRKNIPVNVLTFTRKNVDRNVFANIANGIVLHGFLEVE